MAVCQLSKFSCCAGLIVFVNAVTSPTVTPCGHRHYCSKMEYTGTDKTKCEMTEFELLLK